MVRYNAADDTVQPYMYMCRSYLGSKIVVYIALRKNTFADPTHLYKYKQEYGRESTKEFRVMSEPVIMG